MNETRDDVIGILSPTLFETGTSADVDDATPTDCDGERSSRAAPAVHVVNEDDEPHVAPNVRDKRTQAAVQWLPVRVLELVQQRGALRLVEPADDFVESAPHDASSDGINQVNTRPFVIRSW